MSDVLNGISHFLGICVGIIILLFVIGYILQTSVPTSKPPNPTKKSHYHLVYNNNKSNNDSSSQNTNTKSVENYETSDPFYNNSSIY
jgi:hypothetical protein